MDTRLLPPPSTMKALLPLYDIVKAGVNLVIANYDSYRFVDRNNHDFFAMAKISFQVMARD